MKPTTDVLVRRNQWARDGAKAWDEYLAAPDIVATKTARLRQERLELEAVATVAVEKAANERARLLSVLQAKRSSKKNPEKVVRRNAKVAATKKKRTEPD